MKKEPTLPLIILWKKLYPVEHDVCVCVPGTLYDVCVYVCVCP